MWGCLCHNEWKCGHLLFSTPNIRPKSYFVRKSSNFAGTFVGRSKRFRGLIPSATKDDDKHDKKKKSWWQSFFFEDDGNWLGLKEDDMAELEEEEDSSADEALSENEKFEAWKRRAEAIVELREAQEDMRNEESRRWEDWLVDVDVDGALQDANGSSPWAPASDDGNGSSGDDLPLDPPPDFPPDMGLVKSVRGFILGDDEDDDMLFEDRVFRFASLNSAKFLAFLIVIPLALDFVVHDYVLMPFLDRYVKTVPLAAKLLDVRRDQKLEMIKELKVEKARYRFEVEIGKSPPLSEEETWLELRNKALELREERRFENRVAFANIWSDLVFGLSLFILLYFNQKKVALLKFTGYRIINNISDSGKAFLIILITDIFLGYHSELGWEALIEVIVEHYGLEVDQSTITIFICLIPVVIDACVKLWLFKFLPRLSPRVSNVFREMKRH